MLNLDQLLRVPCVDSKFDISPDDSKLAFAWNKTGEWQIYKLLFTRAERTLSVVEAKSNEEAKQLTSGCRCN